MAHDPEQAEGSVKVWDFIIYDMQIGNNLFQYFDVRYSSLLRVCSMIFNVILICASNQMHEHPVTFSVSVS